MNMSVASSSAAPTTKGWNIALWILQVVLGGMFIFFVLLPISIAYARRVWRRSAKVITTFPREISDRLMRVEQAVEATAIEVERIGEGQRFMTKIFTESAGPQALSAGRAQSDQRQ